MESVESTSCKKPCPERAFAAKPGIINSREFNSAVKKLRDFFQGKGWVEVHTQSRLSILAACEDPSTISTYNYSGQVWPLPQTGQMWLEYELLNNPDIPGCFCLSTSYRNEPNPVEGRHDKIFPMFEFEMKGGMDKLIELEAELLEHLGFGAKDSFPHGNYVDVARKYGVSELEHEHETKLEEDHGPVFFLENFPNYTSPFWNMQQGTNDSAKKVDVIMHGVETIGSAERSCDPEEMRRQFYSISDGHYAKILFSNFTKERVESELNEFLEHKFFQRCGGGIGMTRIIRALKESNLLFE
jgi:aspartyl/asparaginyl-tRNA synthetase